MSESGEMRKQFKAAIQTAENAGRNELITRQRVERLERIIGAFLNLSLRHRLKWVLFGMPPMPPKPEPAMEPAMDVPDVH